MKNLGHFTLIELLVVIAVIAILASLLLPALASAKEASRAILCSNNMRQTSLLLFSYEADYNKLPATWGPSGSFSLGGNNYGYNAWSAKLMLSGLMARTPGSYWGPGQANTKILKCPNNPTATVYSHYGMNPVLAYVTGVEDNSGHYAWDETFLDRTKITRPSERLLLGESCDYGMIQGNNTVDAPNGFAVYPHSGYKMKIIFVDGHAGTGVYGRMGGTWSILFGGGTLSAGI